MQAGVSNEVERVLEIHEGKRTGVLLEIDEKLELPNYVIVPNVQRVFLNSQTNMKKYLASNVTSHTKKVTKVADFQSVKSHNFYYKVGSGFVFFIALSSAKSMCWRSECA